MSGTNTIVQQLFNTGHPTAEGVGYVLQALLNAGKPGGNIPIIVEHISKEGTTRMMFSRRKLSTPFDNAVQNIKRELGIRGGSISITGLFYDENGILQTTPILIAQESWPDLMTHVHKIFVRSS